MATGDIISVEVLGSSPHNGWCAKVVIDGFVDGAVYDFGLGAGNDPANAKFRLTVTSEGYNSSGVLGTTTRTVYGTMVCKKAYPNHAVNDETESGGDLEVIVVLSDYVYDDDDLAGNGVADIAVAIDAGWCVNSGSGGGSESSAAFSGTATNSSSVDYPPVIANWSDVPPGRMTATVDVGLKPLHKHAMNGLQVACVAFDISDGHSHTDSQAVSTPTEATGPTGMPVFEEYRCTLGLTQMDQGDDVTIRARAYPWVGDADSIWDSGTTTTVGSGKRALLGLCDKTGAYGLPYAYVATTGDDGTGVVSTTAATAAASPYLTIWAAVKGVRDFINTNYSRSNSLNNGVIRVQNGDFAFGRNGTATVMTAASAPVIIEAAPGATSARLVGKEATAQDIRCANVRIRNVGFAPASGNQSNYFASVGSTDCYIFDGVHAVSASTSASATPVASGVEETWCKNCTWDTFYTPATSFGKMLVRGLKLTNASNLAAFLNLNSLRAIVGVWNDDHVTAQFFSMSAAASDVVVSGASFKSSSNNFMSVGYDMTRCGFQNVLAERISSATEPLINFTQTNGTDVLFHNLTLAGQRFNLQNQGAAAKTFLRVQVRNCALRYFASKHDAFASDGTYTGGWQTHYGVGFSGIYSDDNVTFPPNFQGLYSKGGTDGNDDGFVEDASIVGTDAGDGDYSPDTGSPLLNLVPPSLRTSLYDIRGQYLSTDTTAAPAAGAYQPTAVLAVTVDGNAASDGGTVDLGAKGAGSSVDMVCTVSGPSGAAIYITDYSTDAGISEVSEFVPSVIVSGGASDDNTASLRLEQGVETAEVTMTSTYGDGSFLVTLEWEEQSAGAVSALGDGGGWGKIIGQ